MKIPQGKTPCPCGTQLTFESCCGRFIFNQQKPDSVEALMRSRYSANIKKAYKYLVDSWQPAHRPKKISASSKVQWLKLEVISAQQQDNTGSVEFKAYYGHGNHQHALHEKSYFVFENTQWWYTHGDIIEQDHCGHSTL